MLICAVISIPIIFAVTDTKSILAITLPIIGCFYGWLFRNSMVSLIIGGILGFIFGLHPLLSSLFIFVGALIINEYHREYSGKYVAIFFLCLVCIAGIITIITKNLLEGIVIIIMGIILAACCYFIPLLSYIMVVATAVIISLFEGFVVFLSFLLAGYALGSILNPPRIIKEESTRVTYGVYDHIGGNDIRMTNSSGNLFMDGEGIIGETYPGTDIPKPFGKSFQIKGDSIRETYPGTDIPKPFGKSFQIKGDSIREIDPLTGLPKIIRGKQYKKK